MTDDLLIQRYLDGRLAKDELAALNQRLREDASLRQHLSTIAGHAVAFGDMARCEKKSDVASPPRRAGRSAWSTLALAASLALVAASLSLFFSARPAAVLTLVDSTGTVTWSDGEPISPGEPLPAGTLETVGETSTAQLRFADGTLITLHGASELAFSENEQKILALSRGTISAVVQKQPPGRPMLIRTPSAVAEVVGTTFDLTTRAEDTLLKVAEGLVKLKRLVDGSQIDVEANCSAVASLNPAAALDAASTPEPLTTWKFDFTTTAPPRDWRGVSKKGSMHASPYVAKKQPDGRIITHHGISIRTAMLPEPQRLLVTENSVIRYRLRQQQPGPLQLMLLTNRLNGNHGGNFECRIPAEELRPSADGWCDIAIPISRYEPVDPRAHIQKRHPTPAGILLTSAIISTFREPRDLEVSHFELSPR